MLKHPEEKADVNVSAQSETSNGIANATNNLIIDKDIVIQGNSSSKKRIIKVVRIDKNRSHEIKNAILEKLNEGNNQTNDENLFTTDNSSAFVDAITNDTQKHNKQQLVPIIKQEKSSISRTQISKPKKESLPESTIQIHHVNREGEEETIVNKTLKEPSKIPPFYRLPNYLKEQRSFDSTYQNINLIEHLKDDETPQKQTSVSVDAKIKEEEAENVDEILLNKVKKHSPEVDVKLEVITSKELTLPKTPLSTNTSDPTDLHENNTAFEILKQLSPTKKVEIRRKPTTYCQIIETVALIHNSDQSSNPSPVKDIEENKNQEQPENAVDLLLRTFGDGTKLNNTSEDEIEYDLQNLTGSEKYSSEDEKVPEEMNNDPNDGDKLVLRSPIEYIDNLVLLSEKCCDLAEIKFAEEQNTSPIIIESKILTETEKMDLSSLGSKMPLNKGPNEPIRVVDSSNNLQAKSIINKMTFTPDSINVSDLEESKHSRHVESQEQNSNSPLVLPKIKKPVETEDPNVIIVVECEEQNLNSSFVIPNIQIPVDTQDSEVIVIIPSEEKRSVLPNIEIPVETQDPNVIVIVGNSIQQNTTCKNVDPKSNDTKPKLDPKPKKGMKSFRKGKINLVERRKPNATKSTPTSSVKCVTESKKSKEDISIKTKTDDLGTSSCYSTKEDVSKSNEPTPISICFPQLNSPKSTTGINKKMDSTNDENFGQTGNHQTSDLTEINDLLLPNANIIELLDTSMLPVKIQTETMLNTNENPDNGSDVSKLVAEVVLDKETVHSSTLKNKTVTNTHSSISYISNSSKSNNSTILEEQTTKKYTNCKTIQPEQKLYLDMSSEIIKEKEVSVKVNHENTGILLKPLKTSLKRKTDDTGEFTHSKSQYTVKDNIRIRKVSFALDEIETPLVDLKEQNVFKDTPDLKKQNLTYASNKSITKPNILKHPTKNNSRTLNDDNVEKIIKENAEISPHLSNEKNSNEDDEIDDVNKIVLDLPKTDENLPITPGALIKKEAIMFSDDSDISDDFEFVGFEDSEIFNYSIKNKTYKKLPPKETIKSTTILDFFQPSTSDHKDKVTDIDKFAKSVSIDSDDGIKIPLKKRKIQVISESESDQSTHSELVDKQIAGTTANPKVNPNPSNISNMETFMPESPMLKKKGRKSKSVSNTTISKNVSNVVTKNPMPKKIKSKSSNVSINSGESIIDLTEINTIPKRRRTISDNTPCLDTNNMNSVGVVESVELVETVGDVGTVKAVGTVETVVVVEAAGDDNSKLKTTSTPKKRGRKPMNKDLDKSLDDSKKSVKTQKLNNYDSDILLVQGKERKLIPVDNTNYSPQPDDIQCGFCKEFTKKKNWIKHLKTHYGIGWLEGAPKIEVQSYSAVLSTMLKFQKTHKIQGFTCRICGNLLKSALGMLTHIQSCNLSHEDKQAKLRTRCEYCANEYSIFSMPSHLRTCTVLNQTKECESKSQSVKTNAEATSSDNQIFSNTGRVKRRSVIKAEKIIKDVGKTLDFDPDELIRTLNNHGLGHLTTWKKEISVAGLAKCPSINCNFTGNTIEIMKEHIKECTTYPSVNYECKKCKYTNIDFEKMLKHVETHKTVETEVDDFCAIENISESDSESYISVEESELIKEELYDENESNYTPQYNVPKNRRGGFQPMRNTNIVERSTAFTHFFTDRNHTSQILLKWAEPLAVSITFQQEYIPKNLESMKFAYTSINQFNRQTGESKPDSDWISLQQFESKSFKNEMLLFIGGPIKCLAWVPIVRNEFTAQYLAVAYRRSFTSYSRAVEKCPKKTLVLIWKIENSESIMEPAKIIYGILIDMGPIHHLEFMPSGGYAPKINRLGLLAIGSVEANIKVYALPIEPTQNDEENIIEPFEIIALKPAFELTYDVRKNWSNTEKICTFQTFRIAWSEVYGHNHIVGGFSNGSVAIWDITNEEDNISRFVERSVIKYVPISFFRDSEKGIVDIKLHYNKDLRWMVVAAVSREIFVYDLKQLNRPVMLSYETGKNAVNCAEWPLIWENYNIGLGESLATYGCLLTTISPLNLIFKNRRALKIVSGVTCTHFNSWYNVFAVGSENGDTIIKFTREMYSDISKMSHACEKMLAIADIVKLNGMKTEVKPYSEINKVSPDWRIFRKDYMENYGVVFGSFVKFDKEKHSHVVNKKRDPGLDLSQFVQVNCLRFNLNENAKDIMAVGYENGFIRIMRIKPTY